MLPDIQHRMNINEMHIDGTPNGQYALRILKAYRRRCDEMWQVSGLSNERTQVYETMNQHQTARAAELDRAIEILEKHLR